MERTSMVATALVRECLSQLHEGLRSGLDAYLNTRLMRDLFTSGITLKSITNLFEEHIKNSARNALLQRHPETVLRKTIVGLSNRQHEIDVGISIPINGKNFGFVIECKMPDFMALVTERKKGMSVSSSIENHLLLQYAVLSELVFDMYDARIETELFKPSKLDEAYNIIVSLKVLDAKAVGLAMVYGIQTIQPTMKCLQRFIASLFGKMGVDSNSLLSQLRKQASFVPPEEILSALRTSPRRENYSPEVNALVDFVTRYARRVDDLPSRNEVHAYLEKRYWDFQRLHKLAVMEE